MAKIITKGEGRREVEYDSMEIRITFCEKKRLVKDSIKEALDDCEEFLGRLKAAGFDINKIRAGDNKIDRQVYSDEKSVITTREISFKADYDAELINVMMRILEEGAYNVNFHVMPYLSDIKSIHDELRVMATDDARNTAETMARAAGLEIAGIERIKIDHYDYNIFEIEDEKMSVLANREGVVGDISLLDIGGRGLYAELGNPTTTEEEIVYIEWILE